MASSTSHHTNTNLTTRRRHDVFLSFRGPDTRKGFTDHLYNALIKSGITTFIDENEMEYGKQIGPECIKAIEDSKCSIVVISNGYASSTWCLDELVHIIRCSHTMNHSVLPVFYDVDPSDVEDQSGCFKDAFDQYMVMFEDDLVRRWRAALTGVACLKGIDPRNCEDGHEARIIERIVKETTKKLGPLRLQVAIHPVDLDRPADEVISLLGDSTSNVRIVSLYGMGGIGKTTIAKKVYNRIFDDFEGSCFLENINTKLSYDPTGLVQLQRQLLSQTLRRKFDKIYNADMGPSLIKERLSELKVLIILDDVYKASLLHQILGSYEWLLPGSRVIITTRNKDFLEHSQYYKQYKVKELRVRESLQLLSLHAFDQYELPIEYMECAYKIGSYAKGIPLVLEVLGSSLRGQGVDVWTNRLEKLDSISDKDIHKVLEVSYQVLDDIDKRLFLDIACIFVGEEKNYVMSILDGCGLFPIDGLNTLMRRCLVSIGPNNELLMHDLLRDMGREIVRQESSLLGKRSRIWRHEDAIKVLTYGMGEIEVEALVVYGNWTTKKGKRPFQPYESGKQTKINHHKNGVEVSIDKMSELEVESFMLDEMQSDGISISTKAFKKMKQLRLLQLNHVHLEGSFHYLSKSVCWLRWLGFPLDVIPCDLYLGNLVALDMRYSKLKQFPKDAKSLSRLKILNLSHSQDLLAVSNFESFCSLEELILEDCISLVEVAESITLLRNLVSLNLQGCKRLNNLPRSLTSLPLLEYLNISGCSSLEEYATEMEDMTVTTDAIGTVSTVVTTDAIGTFSTVVTTEAIGTFSTVVKRTATRLKILPSQGYDFVELPTKGDDFMDDLVTDFMDDFADFMDDFVELQTKGDDFVDDCVELITKGAHIVSVFPSNLTKLNLSFTNITKLPAEMGTLLPRLTGLWLNGCLKLTSVPVLPSNLMTLHARGCISLRRIDLRNYAGDELDLTSCDQLKVVSGYYKLKTLQPEIVRKVLKASYLFIEDSFEVMKIRVLNIVTETYAICPIQGLQDNGIYNIFLPNMELPSWFDHQEKGSSIILKVPRARKGSRISGFIIAGVYGFNPPEYDLLACPGIGVFNIFNEKCWIYEPRFVFLPVYPIESILWLSYWQINSFSSGGGKICIEIHMGDVRVRSCGVHFLYQDEHDLSDSYNPFDLPNISSTNLGNWGTSFGTQSSHARFSYNENNEFTGYCASDDSLCKSLGEHLRFIRGRWERFKRKFRRSYESKQSPRFSSGGVAASPGDPFMMKELRWTQYLQENFVACANRLGLAEKEISKAILTLKETDGLTVFHVLDILEDCLSTGGTEGKSERRTSSINASQIDEKTESSVLKIAFFSVHLHEQLEIQRNLQLRIEEQGRRLKMMFDHQKNTNSNVSQFSDLKMLIKYIHEPRIIERIVKETTKKLGPLRLQVAIHPVDLDRPADEVISSFGDSTSNVRIVSLYGMEGIGKTTIAKKVYNTIFDDFEGSCFLKNINTKLSYYPTGLVQLQRQLLSDFEKKV